MDNTLRCNARCNSTNWRVVRYRTADVRRLKSALQIDACRAIKSRENDISGLIILIPREYVPVNEAR